MAYKLIYKEKGIITYYYGFISDQDLLGSSDEKYNSDTDFSELNFLLSDFTHGSDFQISTDALREGGRMARDRFRDNPHLAMVGILPSDLQFGSGRMWQTHADSNDHRTLMCRSYNDAFAWLKKHHVDYSYEQYMDDIKDLPQS